jgi:hypothetical protein
MQKPVNNSGLRCHHDRKPVEKVCHLCPKYILVRGADPQTGKDVDTWDCADAWQPLLLIEVANAIRKTDAEVSGLRKDVRENNPVVKMLDSMNGSTKSIT